MTTETVPAEAAPEAPTESSVAASTTPKKERKPRKPRTPKPKGAAEDGAPQAEHEEDNSHKVFVGNLAFTTTSEELSSFSAAAGSVVKVEIISRGTRSLGYGFVSYNTEEEAQKAVTLFDKQELGGRQINVELAKLREAAEGGKKRARSTRKGSRFGRGGRRRTKKGSTSDGEGAAEKRVDDDEPTDGDAAATTSAGEDAEGGPKGSGRGRRGRGTGRSSTGRRRFPRSAGELNPAGVPEENGPLSDTTLFVANLPFKVSDDELKAIFKDYKVTTAKVVRLKNGKSKGFGFVEVESHEEQQRVLSELTNVVVDSRELVVKVALASAVKAGEDDAVAAVEAAPAAEEVKA